MSASECKRYLLILLSGRELSGIHAGYGNSFGFLCATMGIVVSGLLTGPAESVWDLFELSCAFLWDGWSRDK